MKKQSKHTLNSSQIKYIKTYKPKYVFHCASMLIQDSETLPRKAINTNIMGTFNVVDLSNKYNVEKICYSSSASVYGEPKYLPVDENHPFQYENFIYGWTKISRTYKDPKTGFFVFSIF